jgi:hypothetical protein
MDAQLSDLDRKVRTVLRDLVGDRADGLFAAVPPATDVMAEALAADHGAEAATEIAFHLADWSSDMALLLALHLQPEAFTKQEIASGLELLLIHAPNHLAAAAQLSGNPVSDVFEVGVLADGDS